MNAKGKLLYSDVLDKHGLAPRSPRQRNLLDILAVLPWTQPLSSSLAVADKGQKITRASLRVDGAIPTLACNAEIWSFAHGRQLRVMELAKLMGHDTSKYDFSKTSMTAFRAMLGNSVHVATLGQVIACLFATLGSTDWSR